MYRMKISRKDKLDVVVFFETFEQMQVFKEWVEELISSVKKKVERDTKVEK